MSSIAVVVVFFLAKDYFGLTELGWVRYVAGVLLIGLGVREYRHGHSHREGHLHGESHSHSHSDEDQHSHSHEDDSSNTHDENGHSQAHDEDGHSHAHDGGHANAEVHTDSTGDGSDGDDSHGHSHLSTEDVDEAGLWGIVGTAFVLGFAHEEEFEIIGLCLGSSYCLELMFVYALAVLVALVALTLLLVAGFEHYGERVEQYTEYLPTVSAVVLIALGFGFIFGVV